MNTYQRPLPTPARLPSAVAATLPAMALIAFFLSGTALAQSNLDTRARIDLPNAPAPATQTGQPQNKSGATQPLQQRNTNPNPRGATGTPTSITPTPAQVGAQAQAGGLRPADLNNQGLVRDTASMDLLNSTQGQQNSQAQGNYGNLDRATSLPQGTIQRAWDRPAATPGQVAPGVVQFTWHPHLIMQIRVRDFMVTEIILPEWEAATDVYAGDATAIEATDMRKNVVAVRPIAAGIDTTLTIIGQSGNVYKFYVRSDGFNGAAIADLTVLVAASRGGRSFGGAQLAPGPQSNATAPGANPSPSPDAIPRNGFVRNASAMTGGITGTPAPALQTAALTGHTADYLRSINVRPEQVTFPYRMFERSPGDREIAPDRVFTDGVWTYLDYGTRGETVRRPVVYAVIDGVDSMVNTRTIGDRQQILVIEVTGTDFTLRNGQKVVCLTIERPDSPRTRNIEPVLSPAPPRADQTMYEKFFGSPKQAQAPGEIRPALDGTKQQ